MDKPGQLRDWLFRVHPGLRANPECLHLLVDAGIIQSTPAGHSLSFEYQYELLLLITDFGEPVDSLIVPLLAWCREQQPELFRYPNQNHGIRFRVEPLNHLTCDVEITLPLTERVTVTEKNGEYQIDHPAEPVWPVESSAINA